MAAGHQSVRVSVCGITSPLPPLATYLQAYSLYRLSQSRFSVACDRQPTIMVLVLPEVLSKKITITKFPQVTQLL